MGLRIIRPKYANTSIRRMGAVCCQNRNITARESARIQTFPDNFIFYGKKTTLSKSLLRKKGIYEELHLDQFNQVGNAVPVQLAQILAKELKKYI